MGEEEEGYLIQRHKNSPLALPPLSEGKEGGGEGERDRPSRPRFTTSLHSAYFAFGWAGRLLRHGSQSRGVGRRDRQPVGRVANGYRDDSSIKM